jgi:hypothetical protein
MASSKRSKADTTGTAGGRRTTVVGLFERHGDAERAIGDLTAAGFTQDRIGIAARDATTRDRLGESTGVEAHDLGAKVGAGALVGGAVGALASLLIPGLGPVLAAGTLGAVLTGAGIGAGVGGLVGALTAWGVSEEDARHFEQGFTRGGTLVTVHADARAAEARNILRAAGADLGPTAVSEAGGTSAGAMSASGMAGTTGMMDAAGSASMAGTTGAGRTHSMERREERQIEGADTAEPWRGNERRFHDDPSFAGPERRRHLLNV